MDTATHLRPAREGLLVPDLERGGYLPPEGRTVAALDYYWQRRLRDGDVIQGKATAGASSKKTSSKKAEPKS